MRRIKSEEEYTVLGKGHIEYHPLRFKDGYLVFRSYPYRIFEDENEDSVTAPMPDITAVKPRGDGIRIENRVYQEGPFSKVTLFQLWPVYSKKPEKLKDFFRDTREIIHIIPDSFITPGKVGHLAVRRLGGYH
ncbi:MAG: hypothetical protein PHU12_03970, partial [Candidatus Aenigmarchaeota archaeon]|nr:hypothetical protein [Candidatus Aenigmarchaeota archaeon]